MGINYLRYLDGINIKKTSQEVLLFLKDNVENLINNNIKHFLLSLNNETLLIIIGRKNKYTLNFNGFKEYIDNKDEYKKTILEKIQNSDKDKLINGSFFNSLISLNDSKNYYLKLNSNRKRNFIFYYKEYFNLEIDIKNNNIFIFNKIPFSDILYDNNRKYLESVVIDFIFNFEKKKNEYIKYISNPYRSGYKEKYSKFSELINGTKQFENMDELIKLISIVSRLYQESQSGPITVSIDLKTNPDLVLDNKNQKKYIYLLIKFLLNFKEEYKDHYKQIKELVKFTPNYCENYFTQIFNKLDDGNILLIEDKKKNLLNKQEVHYLYKKEYIVSFFNKISGLFNVDEKNNYEMKLLPDVLDFLNRYQNSGYNEMKIFKTIHYILNQISFEEVVDKLRNTSINLKTYYGKMIYYFNNLKNINEQKNFIQTLALDYEGAIEKELSDFVDYKGRTTLTDYNELEISVVSDLHLYGGLEINKKNFSINFNIIAGDFIEADLTNEIIKNENEITIRGIGVLGNHDVMWNKYTELLELEIESNYRNSISNLKRIFPYIKILNNEVYYLNGIAFLGLTTLTDDAIIKDQKSKTFFKDLKLGSFFSEINEIKVARILLESIDKSTPIVVISHSPFKEYAVSSNGKIGIESNYIFKDFPNVKVYIHGHGHSKPEKQYKHGILCISNPIGNKKNHDNSMELRWDDVFY